MKILLFLCLILTNLYANGLRESSLFHNIEEKLNQILTGPKSICSDKIQEKKQKKYKNKKSKIEDVNGQNIEISLVTKEVLNEIFDDMKNQTHIPFDYPRDGCYARAHEMSILLEKKGIITAKIFAEGDLRVKTNKGKNGEVKWWFHVAPILKVKEDKEEKIYVIDPSLFDKPVSYEEWTEIQTKHDSNALEKLYFTKRFYYNPISIKEKKRKKYNDQDLQNSDYALSYYLEIQNYRTQAK